MNNQSINIEEICIVCDWSAGGPQPILVECEINGSSDTQFKWRSREGGLNELVIPKYKDDYVELLEAEVGRLELLLREESIAAVKAKFAALIKLSCEWRQYIGGPDTYTHCADQVQKILYATGAELRATLGGREAVTHPSHKKAIDAVGDVRGMKPDDAREYLEMLGCVAIHFMRATGGDEYTRGWLEHALADLDAPPLIELRRPQ